MSAGQTWDLDEYMTNARFVPQLASDVVAWLAAKRGERVLDVGCGDGALTEALQRSGLDVTGVDASPELLAAARKRGLNVHLADAQALPFRSEFDAVFTNATLHWVPDLAAAARSAYTALVPGGRFVGEFGGHGNVAAICTAFRAVAAARGLTDLAMPWNYPTPEEFDVVLRFVGFEPRRVTLIPRPTPLPTGMLGWLRTFTSTLVGQFPLEARDQVVQEVTTALKWSLCDTKGRWHADYVRLRFEAVKA
jgi:SAM-dependent methyltransferase